MRIIIVGAGATGILTALCILRQADATTQVTLMDGISPIGAGVAYSTTNEALLLNVRAIQMSAYADQPNHFVEWLTKNNHISNGEAFVPRTWYARYLQDSLTEAIRQSNGQYAFIPSSVTDIDPKHRIVVCENGQQYRADHVILALGHAPIANPLARWASNPNRMLSGYDWHAITSKVTPEDDVIIIGSGLTMVDTVVALQHHGHCGNIFALSRHGLVPQTHIPRQSYPSVITSAHYGWSVAALMRLVRAEVAKALAAGIPWHAVIDSLRPHNQHIWTHWSLIEKRRFLRHVRAHWDIYRHRIAPEIAGIINATPHLHVIAGRVTDYQEQVSAVDLSVLHRHTNTTRTLTAAYVINCTGPLSDYALIDNSLVARLRQKGILAADDIQLGIAVDAHGHLIDQQQQVIPWLWTLGPPRKGYAWECIAIPDIRTQAVTLANDVFATT